MADDYEREHMRGVGEVLHRQKATVHPAAFALLAIPFLAVLPELLSGASALASAALLGGAALGAMAMAAGMLLFASVRLVVSEGEVSARVGLKGPRVAVADIASVTQGPSGKRGYSLGSYPFEGMTYVKMHGDDERAIHVHGRDGTRLVLVTEDPDALLAALNEAVARRDRRSPRVRVETSDMAVPGETGEEPSPSKAADPQRRGA